MDKINVEYVSLDSLKEYKMNCKLHPQEQIEQIKKSIQEFGFNDPIAVWHDNEIIEGHGRLLAAQELGIDTVPIIRLDHLTDDERRAYMLVHNKLTMNSGFDDDMLNIELESIDIDMEPYGFETEDVEQFDETGLDSDETKENVIVNINCGTVSNYESIKEKLQNITDEIGGTMSIKMQ